MNWFRYITQYAQEIVSLTSTTTIDLEKEVIRTYLKLKNKSLEVINLVICCRKFTCFYLVLNETMKSSALVVKVIQFFFLVYWYFTCECLQKVKYIFLKFKIVIETSVNEYIHTYMNRYVNTYFLLLYISTGGVVECCPGYSWNKIENRCIGQFYVI